MATAAAGELAAVAPGSAFRSAVVATAPLALPPAAAGGFPADACVPADGGGGSTVPAAVGRPFRSPAPAAVGRAPAGTVTVTG